MNDNTKKAIVVIGLVLVGLGIFSYKNAAEKSQDNSNSMSEMTNMDSTMNTNDTSHSAKKVEGIQETNKVTYKGFDVVEKHIRVKKGTTVTWTNQDAAQHDVTPVDDSAFKATKLFSKGETASITFDTVGTFEYFCSPHPYMKGIVEVVE